MLRTQIEENLKRDITRFGVAALAINGMIGAGIFRLPAAAAAGAGKFSPIMFVICGLLMSTIVLSLSQASSFFKETGGPILYTGSAFGPFVGFQTGWLLYLGRVSAMAANSNVLVDYLGTIWPVVSRSYGRVLTILIIYLFFIFINSIGVRDGIRTTITITILKLAPLVIFIAIGLSHFKLSEITPIEVPAFSGFSSTLLLLFYAFVGFEGALVPAGEAKNPKHNMPRALLGTLLITILLYFLIQTVCLLLLDDPASSTAPLADAASILFGPIGIWLLTLVAIISIAGNLSALILTAPRMTYAMGRDRTLPAWFGRIHPRMLTPVNSILFLGGLSFVLAIGGTFVWLAVMSSLTRLIGYFISIIALPRIKKKFKKDSAGMGLPGGYLIPVCAAIICIWLASYTSMGTWLMTAGFIALGSLLYVVARLKGNRD